jgi:hypothetical protein
LFRKKQYCEKGVSGGRRPYDLIRGFEEKISNKIISFQT